MKHKLVMSSDILERVLLLVSLSLLQWVVLRKGFSQCPSEDLSCATRQLSWLHWIYPQMDLATWSSPDRRPHGSLNVPWTVLQERNPELGGATSFISSSKQALSLSQKETSRLCAANTNLRNGPLKGCPGLASKCKTLLSLKHLDKMS